MKRINDGLNSAELYDMIGLQPEIVGKLNIISGQVDLGQVENYLNGMMDMDTAQQSYRDLKAFFKEDEGCLKMLYCQLECARRLFGQYREKQIAKSIYVDTMKCFTRFIEECREKNRRMYFDRGWWTYRQISMNIFRIGALEYQFKEYEGEKVIALHIPSDADMSRDSVEASFQQAELFFQTYYREYEYSKYTCNSWLMSPVLRPLLSRDSNILSFQNRFSIIKEDREDKEYIEWLFCVPTDTEYEELPQATSLQRKVRELLLKGGAVGSAFGIMDAPGR